MKKLIPLILLISFCSVGKQTTNEELKIDSTILSTITTATSTTTTVFKVSEKVKGSELAVGDCFNNNSSDGYYLSEDTIIERVPCDNLHQFEVITTVNYVSNEETEFNNEGVPNLELYDTCEKSYLEKFNLTLNDVISVGDGANDINLIKNSGIGISYKGKKILNDVADVVFNYTNLKGVLHLQNYEI